MSSISIKKKQRRLVSSIHPFFHHQRVIKPSNNHVQYAARVVLYKDEMPRQHLVFLINPKRRFMLSCLTLI